jgi:hypothetical protein
MFTHFDESRVTTGAFLSEEAKMYIYLVTLVIYLVRGPIPVKKNNRTSPGAVVIVSANETEDRGFESRQGVRILGPSTTLSAMLFFVT